MTASSSTIYLLDVASGEGVEAELRDAIEEAQIIDWQMKWQPALTAILQELAERGVPTDRWPQSWHWNWSRKADQIRGLLAYRGFSVVAQGETQGLAQVELMRSAHEKSQAGRLLVYVSYLEVAPWNRGELGCPPRLRGVGTALLTAAVALSQEEGCKGRIGLHSLPQSDEFYRHYGMTDLGPDPNCQNLSYFEMTVEQAMTFLGREEGQ